VIVVDSMSHEHAGEGGILDMQEAEFARMGGRDAVKMASWIKPKGEHRRMVSRLLQVRAHLILCFRAEEKIEMAKEMVDGREKMVVRKKQTATGLDGWQPICEKNLPYELTASFLLMAARPGVPLPIKLQEQHKALFPLDQPITEQSGKSLAKWAAGGTPPSQAAAGSPAAPAAAGAPSVDEALIMKAQEWADCGTDKYASWWAKITPAQRKAIGAARHEVFKAIAEKVPA